MTTGHEIMTATGLKYEEVDKLQGMYGPPSSAALSAFFDDHSAGGVVLLWRLQETSGHWVYIHRTGPKSLGYYEPYGLELGQEVDYGARDPTNWLLISSAGWDIDQLANYDCVLQAPGVEDNNPCGRYSISAARYVRRTARPSVKGWLEAEKLPCMPPGKRATGPSLADRRIVELTNPILGI